MSNIPVSNSEPIESAIATATNPSKDSLEPRIQCLEGQIRVVTQEIQKLSLQLSVSLI
ncbi:hypothetical protein HMI56_004670 [Coelomomyces lativittatus]|nr:hypothetical protein HMI56_004670 [Coelomomyces lativittatus]